MKAFAPITATIILSLCMANVFAQEATTVADTQTVPQPVAAPVVTEVAAPTTEAQPTTVAAPQLPKEVTDVIGLPETGKALVVFFRPKNFVGGAIGFIVREKEAELGKLRNGNYFAIQVTPGAHEYIVHSEAKDITKIEVEEGETYFLKGEITMGFMAGRPNLSPSTVINFQSDLKKLKPSKPLK
jgi:hypothetical protein